MRLIMLGTGMAMVTKCYNTCFVLADHTGSFMVDGGGGNGIFRQAEAAQELFLLLRGALFLAFAAVRAGSFFAHGNALPLSKYPGGVY